MTLAVDSNLDFQSVNTAVNLPTPISSGDAANKAYVDAVAQGIIYKEAVAAVSTTNVSVASPGAIGSASTGDRVLLAGQTTESENGLWTWNGATSALTRTPDFDTGSTQEPGTSVFDEGTDTSWTLINTGNVTVDTTDQSWTQTTSAGSLTFDAPLTQSGSTVSLNGGDPLDVTDGGTGASTPAGARSNLNATGKYATTVGDASATSFTITHNLGTTDIQVSVYDMATGAQELVGVTVDTVNTCTVGAFGSAPAAATGTIGSGTGKRVVVIG
jgi:hypothetical protein